MLEVLEAALGFEDEEEYEDEYENEDDFPEAPPIIANVLATRRRRTLASMALCPCPMPCQTADAGEWDGPPHPRSLMRCRPLSFNPMRAARRSLPRGSARCLRRETGEELFDRVENN